MTDVLSVSTITVLILLLAVFTLVYHLQQAHAQDWREYEFTYEKNAFSVSGAMSGDGKITGIQVFPEYGSILISIDMGSTSQDDKLRIILPRDLIDSKSEGVDSKFLVIVDDEDVEYRELEATETQRELEIPLHKDSLEIEIFGSQIIPEFPYKTVATLVTGIISVVTISIYRIKFLEKRLF